MMVSTSSAENTYLLSLSHIWIPPTSIALTNASTASEIRHFSYLQHIVTQPQCSEVHTPNTEYARARSIILCAINFVFRPAESRRGARQAAAAGMEPFGIGREEGVGTYEGKQLTINYLLLLDELIICTSV